MRNSLVAPRSLVDFSSKPRISNLRTVPINTEVFFAWFMTMREKKILARAMEIQKENGGNHAFFRDN